MPNPVAIFSAKNKIYTGYDGDRLGYQAVTSFSSSCFSPIISGDFYLSPNYTLNTGGKEYKPFSGSFQELRFYNTNIKPNVFNDYVMNPYSIEGNDVLTPSSSLNTLTFRAPLGTVLDNNDGVNRTSIHPAISRLPQTNSFASANSAYEVTGNTFTAQTEIIYQDQFHSGIKNAVSEKIRRITTITPSGDTLSPYISIQQTSPVSESFTKDINYVEVAFSPQDEINDDIISQLGSFNIGDYIGDPRQVSSSLNYYPDFNKLRDNYFTKYVENYNIWDYIRLIKFYDNSLFKMIKDFTPARTSLSTGIVIKQTLLERNKYPRPQVTSNSTIAFVGSPTTKTINIAY